MLRLWEKVWQNTLVQLCLPDHSALKKLFSGVVEGSLQEGKECKGIFGENLSVKVVDCPSNIDSLENGVGGSHFVYIVFGCYYKMNGCGRKKG